MCLGVTKDTDGAMVTKQLNCNGSHIQTMCITEDGIFTSKVYMITLHFTASMATDFVTSEVSKAINLS